MSLRERIIWEIEQRGPIPFSRYMEMCLYEPEEGYYSRPQEKFGRAGDFYTSSDVHAVFGRLLARQFEEMWRRLGAPARLELVELGPGCGLFARDVLDWSRKKLPQFFAALDCRLVESSPSLRRGLEERLGEYVAQKKVSVAVDMDESAPAQHAIVFANEFFDALPVEVLDARGELRVGAHEGRFAEMFVPPTREVLECLDLYGVHPEDGERVEAGLEAQRWVSRMARIAERAFFVLIDYGYTREELLAGRHRGTVMAYRRHTASANPYDAPGEQDITAHVNFTALSGAAREAGLDVLGLVTQAQFLMGIGEANQFADAFEDCRMPQERAKVALQLKHLVSPAGMGESFQVLVLGKGVTKEGIRGLAFGR
ncbi:MAG TPA: SAM-dependent methyltransferase [Terriglobales bacterium]|nr:SAM-dependent methyltransferase [Terriglobales bacterium]